VLFACWLAFRVLTFPSLGPFQRVSVSRPFAFFWCPQLLIALVFPVREHLSLLTFPILNCLSLSALQEVSATRSLALFPCPHTSLTLFSPAREYYLFLLW
jgi:hypothetical protein